MPAAITFNGNVIDLANLTTPEFSFNGFLSNFYYKNKHVRYCDISDVRENNAINDYYYWEGYVAYRNNTITIDELVEKHKFKDFDTIHSNPNGSSPVIIYVNKIYFSSPNYSELFFTQAYRWDYIEGEEIFFYDNKFNPVIKLPQRAIDNADEPFPKEIPIALVQSFYDKNKYLILEEEFDEIRLSIARYLSSICWMIQRIAEDIFPLFSADSDFNAYITHQKNEWINETIMDTPDYQLLVSYYEGLLDFYHAASLYRMNINSFEGIEKLHFLTRLLNTKAISIIPINDRFKVLKLMIDKYLSSVNKVEVEEKIVIRIVQSFAYNQESDRNEFLTRLVSPNFNGDGDIGKTMYEVLNDRMSTAWEITRFSIGLINWTFNATWKPTDTRGMFVKSVYGLWLRSKYNPYDFDTFEPKATSLALKKLVDGTMYYQQNEINTNEPLDFNTTKPNRVFFYTDYPGYKILPADENISERYVDTYWEAAPILLKYESKKTGGFYMDNFSFEFSKDHIIARIAHMEVANRVGGVENYALYGNYHILQPVHLSSNSIDTAEPILLTEGDTINFNGTNINSLVPVFFLKYIDELGDSKDIQHFMGLAVDVVSTFIPVANLAKLRHIRHLTRFGKTMLVVETVQISAGVLNFFLGFVDACNIEGTFCQKLRKVLFFLELSSLSADVFMMQKARKSAKETVEEALENGWPIEMLDEIPGTGGITPKMKIEELAGNITKFIEKYKSKCKETLIDDFSKDLDFDPDRYMPEEIDELIDVGLEKGLSVDDTVGVIHQATRIQHQTVSLSIIKDRMSNLLEIRKRKFPYPYSLLDDFNDLLNQDITTIFNMFHLPKKDVHYGGSCITSPTSSTPGLQDIDFFTYVNTQQDLANYKNELILLYKSWSNKVINGKKILPQQTDRIISILEKDFIKTGRIDRSVIRGIDSEGKMWTLRDYLKTLYSETQPIDITIRVKQQRIVKPTIKIKIN